MRSLGIENEIDNLKERLEEFNKKYRVPIMERRKDSIINSVVKSLEKSIEILDKFGIEAVSALAQSDIHYFSEKLRNTLIEKLENLQIEKKKEFLGNTTLSERLKEAILKNIEDPSEQIINDVKKKVSAETSTLEERPDGFNLKLREIQSQEIEKKIREATYIVLNEEVDKVYKRIFKESVKENTGYLKSSGDISPEDIESDNIDRLIDDFVDKVNLLRTYEVSSLVMRFLGDILELIVKNPLSSEDRRNKLKEANAEVYSLWAFHPAFDPSVNINLIERAIIYQEPLSETVKHLETLKEWIKNLKGENPDLALSVIRSYLSKYPFAYIMEKISKVKSIEQFKNLMDRLEDEGLTPKKPKSYADVVEEIKRDLLNLKEIVESSVIRAINVEKAFVNSTSIYVRTLISKLNSDEYLALVKGIVQQLSVKGAKYDELQKSFRIRDIVDDLKKLKETLQGVT